MDIEYILLRFIFPEFLPDPEPSFRNSVAERLQRKDMIARREVVEIPGAKSPEVNCSIPVLFLRLIDKYSCSSRILCGHHNGCDNI